MFFWLRMIIQTMAILLIAYLMPSLITVEGFIPALAAAFFLGIVNATLRPLFIFLTLPLTLLTLGFFLLIVNALMLWLVSALVSGFMVNGFFGAFFGSLMISLVSWVLSRVVA